MENSHQYGKKICRLCLMKCDKYELIERNIRNDMDVLLLNINLLLNEESVICKDCAERVKKCFYFKTMCLDTHKYLVSFISNKSNIEIALKDIYLSKEEYASGVLKDSNMCGFCMGVVESCFAICLDNEDTMPQKMFEKCFPELDFSIVKKPFICTPCHGHLKDYFSFVTNCLVVEEEIGKYCETLDIKNKTLIDLTEVLQFTLRNKVATGREDVNIINENKDEKYSIHPEHFYEVGEYESIAEVKDQELNNLCQFPLRNMSLDIIDKAGSKIELDGKICDNSENIIEQHEDIKQDLETIITIEEHKFDNILFSPRIMTEEVDVIKKEGKFGEGHVVQKNEYDVGVEDKKYLLNDEIQIKTDPHDFSSFQSASSKLVTSDDSFKNRKYSEPDHHSPPSEALSHESSGECKNDVEKHESITAETLVHKDRLKKRSLVHKDTSKVIMYQCESCPYQAKHKGMLKSHSLVHKDTSEVTMYQCGSCQFQTNRVSSLKSHSLVHKDPLKITMYQCESCPFQTKRKGALKLHVLIHQDPLRIEMYQCELCSFQTKYKESLKKHSLVHKEPLNLTMHQCKSCPFQTKHIGSLKSHVFVHEDPSKVKMYQCESCPFQTNRKDSLKKHLLVHMDASKVTMYQCALCSFETKRKDNLKKHSLVHKNPSKVTMYRCDSCPYQTKRKNTLKNHLLVH